MRKSSFSFHVKISIYVFTTAILLLVLLKQNLVLAEKLDEKDSKQELAAKADVKPASSIDSSDGHINIVVTGGVAPLTIHCLGTKLYGTSYNNLKAGKYTFVVIDSENKTIKLTVELGINK